MSILQDDKQRSSNRASRQAIALLFAVPLVITCLLRSPDERHRITSADEITLRITNYIGDASFALTGAIAAGTEGMDLLGCVIVGFVTALGGGTVRDIALGRLPLFWAVAWDEALLCVVVSCLTFFLWPRFSHRLQLTTSDEWLFWTDTLGLAVFASLGAQVAASQEEPRLNFGACAVMGMFTATFGGLARDVLCQKPPRILYATQEIYAIPAFTGGLACTAILRYSSTLELEAVLLGSWVVIELRVLAINYGIRLPTFANQSTSSTREQMSSLLGEPPYLKFEADTLPDSLVSA